MSTTRMMILGLVRWLQPVHGYDVRRELVSWNVHEWANIQPGSIYHALRKLTEEEMLAEVATERVGARPARTTYRLTAKGEVEFTDLLRKYWWEYHHPVDPFIGALSFLPALARADAVMALRNRARVLTTMSTGLGDMLAAPRSWMADKPEHVRWMFELNVDRGLVEAAWCERVAQRIEAGEGRHEGEPEQEETNRRWRESMAGQLDPNVD